VVVVEVEVLARVDARRHRQYQESNMQNRLLDPLADSLL